MQSHKKRNLMLIFLIGRLGFIFFDGIFNKENLAEKVVYFKNIGINYQQHNSADSEPADPENIETKLTNKLQTQKSNIQDLKTLEYIYDKEKSPKILKEIIKKQAQNYNFNEARNNIKTLEKQGEDIDIHLLIYIYLNSSNLNITQTDSIKKFPELLDTAVNKNLIGTQDYIFYGGLVEIRNKNYSKALEQRKQVKTPEYQAIISSFKNAIQSYDETKAIPQYYQDGLVALAALKNGYFNIARKLSVETIFQDEKYILPYQVLSYAHFLTNNRETAIEYFLKLTSFDKKNTETYQFLIGVSYYRYGDYTSSILYLSQIKDDKNQIDKLRYLTLDYLEINEPNKLIESWQKLLGQTEIKNSDFLLYFYHVFYKAYFSQNTKLYETNKQLATLFIKECENKLGIDDNVCIYGRIGSDIINRQLSPANEVELISLSEAYNQSYLYHILGDMTNKSGRKDDAKKRYAKTITSSQDPKEISFVQEKLSTF